MQDKAKEDLDQNQHCDDCKNVTAMISVAFLVISLICFSIVLILNP